MVRDAKAGGKSEAARPDLLPGARRRGDGIGAASGRRKARCHQKLCCQFFFFLLFRFLLLSMGSLPFVIWSHRFILTCQFKGNHASKGSKPATNASLEETADIQKFGCTLRKQGLDAAYVSSLSGNRVSGDMGNNYLQIEINLELEPWHLFAFFASASN